LSFIYRSFQNTDPALAFYREKKICQPKSWPKAVKILFQLSGEKNTCLFLIRSRSDMAIHALAFGYTLSTIGKQAKNSKKRLIFE
jgi:hypothetical protein